MFDFDLQSVEHARKVHTILVYAHHEAYQAMNKSFDRVKYYADLDSKRSMEPRTKYNDPDLVEFERMTASALKTVVENGKAKFGKSGTPICQLCLEYSVFGGPGHNASGGCRSGGRSHCSCDTCW